MTTAYHAPSRPGAFGGGERLGFLAQLREALDDYRAYGRTVAELSALSPRQLRDIGLEGQDLAEIARGASRG